jgi:Thioredoxin
MITDHMQGDPHASVALVEYGDYQCPVCGLAYPIVKGVQKHFGKRLRFAFRNFPLTQIHPEAESAAETAEFASTHERFWQMHDALYENQDGFTLRMPSVTAVTAYVRQLATSSLANGTPPVKDERGALFHQSVKPHPPFQHS